MVCTCSFRRKLAASMPMLSGFFLTAQSGRRRNIQAGAVMRPTVRENFYFETGFSTAVLRSSLATIR
jgi:hypothetical protein